MVYGRCFMHPWLKLIDLANAAGMSISGVRIAFDDDEIAQAADILHRPRRLATAPAWQRHEHHTRRRNCSSSASSALRNLMA